MGKNTIEFYSNPQSRSRIVRWMLEELSVPYEVKVIEYGAQMKSEPYISINPMGKVPAIVHNGKVVTECAAICTYLADVFPDSRLAPPLNERAAYYRWMFFAAGPLEAAISNRTFGFEIPKEKQRSIGYGNFDTTIDTLAKALSEGPYIAGDYFTAADVFVGSHIGWGLQFNTIPERKEFIDYFKKLRVRPAYVKATQLDTALIEK